MTSRWSLRTVSVAALVASCLVALPAMTLAAETTVYSEGFESGNGGFTLIGSAAGWQWGTPPATPGPGGAHAGAKCWGTNFGTTMGRPSDQSIVSPPIQLPQASPDQIIRVRFWAFVSLDGMYDRGQFFVSKDNASWESLAQFYNNMEQSCVAPAWHKYEFTIDGSYAASADPAQNVIYLRMRAAARSPSPSTGCVTDLSGVYVDDVAITYYDVPATRKVLGLEAWEDPAAWASCPWVAPWNGAAFEPDNDVYPVARTAANEYVDVYRLGVAPVERDGVYPIELWERETEDSFTDAVGLLQIDHLPGVAVAPDELGTLHAFEPAGLIRAVATDSAGTDVSALLSGPDGQGVAAYDGDTVTLDFGNASVASGATLVLGVKGFQLGAGEPTPYVGPPAVVVETMDASGVWVERGRFLPRFDHSVMAFALAPVLSDGQPVVVRLRSISHDVKYHLVDDVGLYAASAPAFAVAQAAPARALFGPNDVTGTLLYADGAYARMTSGDAISLEFPVLPLEPGLVREFAFVSKGYYLPGGGSYLIYTWDGIAWVQRDGRAYGSADSTVSYDLSLFLPDPLGRYVVRIWQDYWWEYAGIDHVSMTVGATPLVLEKAFDLNKNALVTEALSASDDIKDGWATTRPNRNRVVEVTFTPPGPINVPPVVSAVTVTGVDTPTPTISWTYADLDADAQAMAEVEVWTGPGATGTNVWDPADFPGAGTSVVYGGAAPTPGATYYARVRANDGKDWGAWAEAAFVPPMPPFIVSVINPGGGIVTSAPAGIDCGATCEAEFAYGTSVDLTATPFPGWNFVGWSGACTGTGPCTVTGDATVYAAFNAPPSQKWSVTEVTVAEGATAATTGIVVDLDGDPVTLVASAGTVVDEGGGTWSWSFATTGAPGESQTVTITASDGRGGTSTASFDLKVVNVAPVLEITSPASGALYAAGSSVTVVGSFTDAGTADTHTCEVGWDDGAAASAGDVAESDGAGTCTATKTLGAAGVYTVTMAVADGEGGTDVKAVMVVVYDPSAGFVTGGGWFESPAGAFAADPSLSGRANFGFVSKYQRGATVPTGETEFQFKAGGLAFHSAAYEWLVVAGARAQYRGTGSVNGVGGYQFLLTAVDGALPGGGVDGIRVRIWGSGVVYDNFPGSEDINASGVQPISGGSIVIHKQ